MTCGGLKSSGNGYGWRTGGMEAIVSNHFQFTFTAMSQLSAARGPFGKNEIVRMLRIRMLLPDLVAELLEWSEPVTWVCADRVSLNLNGIEHLNEQLSSLRAQSSVSLVRHLKPHFRAYCIGHKGRCVLTKPPFQRQVLSWPPRN